MLALLSTWNGTNEQGQQVLAVEDDASRRVFDIIEMNASSASQSINLLNIVREELDTPITISEVITAHGSEFINRHQDGRPCLDHAFEGCPHRNDTKQTLCKIGRLRLNGKIERFFQTYDKHRWRLRTPAELLAFHDEECPRRSLDWNNNLETPAENFNGFLPPTVNDLDESLTTEVSPDE